jgi:hypothetical protein
MFELPFILGLHLVSYHFDNAKGYNDLTPGIYARTRGDLYAITGAFYNSVKKPSVYLGGGIENEWVGLTIGVMSGYSGTWTSKGVTYTLENPSLIPFAIPYAKLPYGFRLAVVPPVPNAIDSWVVHLSVEF